MSADRASFEEYVAARHRSLLRTAYLLTGHHQDAEDLVQGALVKAADRWSRISERPDAYVRRILANDHVSRWRRHRGREVSVAVLPDTGAVDPVDPDVIALRDALATLAPRQRAVLVLRYFEGLTERETAEALGCAVGTVKSQASDGVRRLRGLLAVETPDRTTSRR